MASRLYERIGTGYAHTRRADPRIARAIDQARAGISEMLRVSRDRVSY